MRGFTLLELMVSTTIGLVVVLAATTFHSSTLNTRTLVESRLALQEHRGFAVQTLRRYLLQAGHRPLRTDDVYGPVLPVSAYESVSPATDGGWSAGSWMRTVPGGLGMRFRGASDAQDRPDGSLSDCTGRAIGADETGEMTFGVANGRLVCSVGDIDVTLAGGDGDTRVLGLDVRFGIDDDGDRSVDRFESAGTDRNAPRGLASLMLELTIRSERVTEADPTVVSIALRNGASGS